MAEITIIPLLNAQQISMSSLAHGATVRPEAAQAISGELALALLQQEAKQVEKTSDTGKSNLVSDEQGGATGGFAGSPRRERRPAKPEESDDEAPASAKPMVGNLLNVKV